MTERIIGYRVEGGEGDSIHGSCGGSRNNPAMSEGAALALIKELIDGGNGKPEDFYLEVVAPSGQDYMFIELLGGEVIEQKL
ncbi:MAG: hypothetical protein ABIJ22_03655 [Patescibacteria group bacterium]